MMVKPSVSELLTKANNRYELVIATARRARQIAAGAKPKTDVKEEDWLVGGTFTGYASYQGFSMIKKFILGELKRSEF